MGGMGLSESAKSLSRDSAQAPPVGRKGATRNGPRVADHEKEKCVKNHPPEKRNEVQASVDLGEGRARWSLWP